MGRLTVDSEESPLLDSRMSADCCTLIIGLGRIPDAVRHLIVKETKSPRLPPGAFVFRAGFSLLADLDLAPAATATTATACGAAGRDNLDPKCVFAFVVRGGGCAAQCIEAVLCCARRCGGESR